MTNNKPPSEMRFEEATFSHMQQLFRLACAKTGNPQDAEDVLQETYIKAYRAFGSLKQQENTKAWLTQILINTLHDHHRRQLRNVKTTDIGDFAEGYLEEPLQLSAEEQICHDEIDPELAAAMKSLPVIFLGPLLLREIHEFTYDEIAEVLAIPIGTVMSRLFRARALLRRALANSEKVLGNDVNSSIEKTSQVRGFHK